MGIKKSLSLVMLSSLLFGQLTAQAFTPHQVENETKILLYWGDIENTASTTSVTFNPEIAPSQHRILGISGFNFESNDSIQHRDSNETGKVEISSKIEGDIDGVLLLINNDETSLEVEFNNLPTQTININSLKTQDFKFTSGDYGVAAKYIGNKFLETPENPSTSGSFNDTPSTEWYFKYVQRIKDRKVDNQPIFEGYKNPDGSLTGVFSPAGDIKVGEMLKVVLRVSGYNETTSNLDASLTGSTHWSVGFLNKAIQLDLTMMQAVGIDPERVVSRGEFFQALVEAQGLSTNCETNGFSFVDLDENNPYTPYACVLVRDGVISGTDAGYLNLYDSINRAEVAKILNTALDIYADQPTSVINTIENLETSTGSTSGGTNNSGSNTGGTTNTDLSFVPTSTSSTLEIGYTSSFKIDFADSSKVRPNDVEFTLLQGNTIATDKLSTPSFAADNSSVSILGKTQWAPGTYTLTIKDTQLNEFKDFNFEILNCGEQANPCPSTGYFVRSSDIASNLVGYTFPIVIEFSDKENVRQGDLTLSLKQNGQDKTSTLAAPTFTSDNSQMNVRQKTQWSPGDYTLTVTDSALADSKEFDFKIMNCGEQDNECPFNPQSFINDSSLDNNQIGYESPARVTFNTPSNVRSENIQYKLSKNGQDETANLGSISYNASTGKSTIYYKFQWPSGTYTLTLTDTVLQEEVSYNFMVLDTP